MPRWEDLTPDVCTDVVGIFALEAFGADERLVEWIELPDLRASDVRRILGLPRDGEPLGGGFDVPAEALPTLEQWVGRDLDRQVSWMLGDTARDPEKVHFHGPAGSLVLTRHDHRLVGLPDDGLELIELVIETPAPHPSRLHQHLTVPSETADAMLALGRTPGSAAPIDLGTGTDKIQLVPSQGRLMVDICCMRPNLHVDMRLTDLEPGKPRPV